MNDPWHDLIQRHLNGQLGAEESAALVEALNRDAELRALYLDYMNLDAALGARAETAAAAAGGETPATLRSAPAPWAWPRRRWLAPAAAFAAVVIFGLLFERRGAAPARPDLDAVTRSARRAISHLPTGVPPAIPAWMSPTAPLLTESGYPL
jgi:hypothetical protein